METTMTDGSAVIITYGNLNCAEGQAPALASFNAGSVQRAKDLAREFISVIPDDLDWYLDQINAWTGEVGTVLLLTHQDDDTFYFSAVRTGGCFMEPTRDTWAFTHFCMQNAV